MPPSNTHTRDHPADDAEAETEADQWREQRMLDMRQPDSERPDFGVTSEGTADPDDIVADDIREAVEEARRRQRDRQRHRDHDQQTPTASARDDDEARETDAATSDADASETETDATDAQPASLPNLADEPSDPEEFFADELGDPQRDIKEARARGLHAAPQTETETETDRETTATAEPETTMPNDPSSRDRTTQHRDETDTQPAPTESTPEDDHAATYVDDEQAAQPAQHDTDVARDRHPDAADQPASTPQNTDQSRRDRDRDRDQSDAHGRDTKAHTADARDQHDDAAAHLNQQTREQGDATMDAQSVDPLTEDDMAQVSEDFGGQGRDGEADGRSMPNPADIDFEAQDVEGASEDRGQQMYEFNGVYFLLDDMDDTTAESLLTSLQDDTLDAEDRFDIIINTVVQKPQNAASRTQNWKFLHRASLAGQCMEHCGLREMMDFQNAPGDTPSPGRGA